MKPKVFNILALCCCILLAGFTSAAAELPTKLKTEYTKSYNKTFDVEDTDKFIVNNRYGKIDVQTWNESKVQVDVLIKVNARSKEAGDEMLERIKITFDQGGGYSSATTEIADKKSSWGSWWSGSSNDDFKINYTVKMPLAHSLDLTNKYGHSYVADFNGTGKFSVKYGDLNANNVGGEVSLYLGYGNGTFLNTSDVDAEIKYSKLRMGDVGHVNMNSKYSKLTFNNTKNLKSISGYDNYTIEGLDNLEYEGKYSDLNIVAVNHMAVVSKYTNLDIGTCANGADVQLSYGGIKIEELGPNFERVDITGSYSGIKVGIHTDASYSFDATSRYAGISYPSGLDIRRDIQSGQNKEISGSKGSDSRSAIKINSSYGGIKVW